MVPTASAKIGILRFVRKIVPLNTLTVMYNAMPLPQFDDTNIIYNSASEIKEIKLLRL